MADINSQSVSTDNTSEQNKERTCQQMLGVFLINVAILNALEIIAKLILRLMYGNNTLLINAIESYVGVVRFILVIILFARCMIKMKPYNIHLPNVRKLLVLWGVILIPIQLINDLCGMLYTRMLELIFSVFYTAGLDQDGKIFALIYDSTHGFKYICIFLAIILGIVMTGEILEKRNLLWFSAGVAILFMLAFTALRMETFSLDAVSSVEIGVNWTSMIFHALTTVGLFSIGMYIERLFKNDPVIIPTNNSDIPGASSAYDSSSENGVAEGSGEDDSKSDDSETSISETTVDSELEPKEN